MMSQPSTDEPPKRHAKHTVLVTGATGFLGAYIVRNLVDKGYAVRAIRRSPKLPEYISPGIMRQVEWVETDLFDLSGLQEALTGVDAIVHAAAKISLQSAEKKEMFRTNIEGTANLVNLALDHDIGRLVHISSVAALGRSRKNETLAEGSPMEKVKLDTAYAESKFHSEMEVWRAIGEGLGAVIVNPSTILGFGDWNQSSCAIFKNIYEEFSWYTQGINGFVDVEDVARAVVLILESDIVGERFLLSGGNWSFRQVFDQIADGFSKRRPFRQAGPFLAGLAWRGEGLKSLITGKPTLLTRESARIAQSRTQFDSSKFLRTFPGFTFTPLEGTIAKACRSYLEMNADQRR
jgi:dihydroflavonol-4-reductase